MEESVCQPFVGKSTYVLPTEGNDDAIVFNIVPNVLNIAKIFGVLFKTFADIEDLMNGLETGKHEDVWSGMTEERRKEVMDSMFTTWKRLMDENPSVASNVHIDKTSAPSHASPIVQVVDINPKTTFYAGAAYTSAKDQPKFNSNFYPLVADPVFNGLTSLFLVKLSKRGCLWMIRNSLIILKKWSMDTSLLKEELTRILIWVKLHDVPLQVFEEDGISLIATFIDKPVMLDSYTSSMCNDSWGRSSFARCLIKVNLKANLIDVVTISIPSLTKDGFTKETIRVEYEWRPPRCDLCKIFCLVHDHCPKRVVSPTIATTSNVVTPTVKMSNDGF
ncbi:zinc knuckle CX2CX4HX4C containing protein [Tanacetum coccineum]